MAINAQLQNVRIGGEQRAGRRALDELRAELPPVIDNHEILKVIGFGAYGQVLLARNTFTGVFRALKVVWKEAFSDDKPYLREFEAIQRFEPISRQAEGFVQVLHVGSFEKAFYYIMELADDDSGSHQFSPENYRPRLLTRKPGDSRPLAECIEIGVQLAQALARLHDQRLIHRDIKPSNIIFVRGKPKLADIGLVAHIEEAHSFVGTVGFVPPEGPTHPESDIYSLGKVLYEIATGNDRCDFPELPPNLGSDSTLYLELNQVILKACDPRLDRRYRTADSMRQELELLRAGASIKRLRLTEKRLKITAAAFAVCGFLGAFFLILKSLHDRDAAATQRRAAYFVTRGTDRLSDGDFAGALPFFLAAARDEPEKAPNYQLRIGSILANGFSKTKTWSMGRVDSSISEDGSLLISAQDDRFEVRDSRTGEIREVLPVPGLFPDNGTSLSFKLTPDHKYVGVLGQTNFVMLERGSTNRRVFPFSTQTLGLNFFPESPEVAIGTVKGFSILNYRTGEVRTRDLPFPVNDAVIDPENDRVLVLSRARPCQVFRLSDLEPISVVFEHDMAYAGAFNPFVTNLVLTSGFDFAVYWDIKSGQIASKPLDHEYGTHCLAFSPNRTIIASGGLDRAVRLSDARSLLPLPKNPVLYHPDLVKTLAFIDDKTLVVNCYDGTVHIWELKSKGYETEEVPWSLLPSPLNASAAGLHLNAESNVVRIAAEGSQPVYMRFDNPVGAVAVHPKGVSFVVGTIKTNFDQHAALVYRRDILASPVLQLRHFDGITHVAYSPSGSKIVTSSEDHTAVVWDAETGKPLTPPLRHRWQVRWAQFNSAETWVATASWDSTVGIWDARTGEPLTTPIDFGFYLHWMALADNDRSILAGADSRKRVLKVKIPMATTPFDQWKDAFPPPATLVLNRSNF